MTGDHNRAGQRKRGAAEAVPAEAAAAAPDYLGHRERLRGRFRDGGAKALADYELLELILYPVIPRRDTKPLAKALLKRFGSFAAVLAAEPKALKEVDGIGDTAALALKAIEAAAHRLHLEEVMERPVMDSWRQVLDYCRAVMAHLKTEQFRILFLDRKNHLIADEVQQTGTVDHTPVYPREVVRRALDLGASAIVMVHNHPSGDPTPSQADIDMTREVEAAAAALGIALHDHVVVGRKGHASLRSLGLI